jgi:predicted 3-demethylubiquinone-9 3-methyltransferase (glyoxalase superfamily)
MKKITPFLWFDDNAEEAVNFYVSLFKNSKIESIAYYPDEVPGMGGQVMNVMFHLDGQDFMGLDGGPGHKPSDATSFLVDCEDQTEVDRLWERLTADGGKEGPCGWLTDKYGFSWQIVPKALREFMSDPDQEKASRVMMAMRDMSKIVVADLQNAYDGK